MGAGTVTYDVVIVGAGIAGASLGFRLAQRCSVLVLEQEPQPGYHATGRSAAMFSETYGPPMVRALTRASRAFCERPPPGFSEVPLLSPRGLMVLAARSQAGALEGLQRTLAGGCALRTLDAAACVERVPILRPQAIDGALFEPDAMDMDVNALHQGFLRGIARQGGMVRTRCVLAQGRRVEAGWELTSTNGERVRARIVVDAAGAWADLVAERCGVAPLGLVPHRRTAFTFLAPPGVDVSGWPSVVGVAHDYYFKPDAGRLLGSPSDAHPTFAHDVLPEAIDVATGIDRIQAVTALSIHRPANAWAGLRTLARDGEPVVGWDDRCPGFFWLAGQGGYGIKTAAAASELAAALVCGEPAPTGLVACGVDSAALQPQRLRR